MVEGLRSVQAEEGAEDPLTLRCRYQSATPMEATWYIQHYMENRVMDILTIGLDQTPN